MHSARKCPPFPVRGRNAPKRAGQTMEYTVWSVAADRPAMIIPLLYHNFNEFQPFFWDLKIFNFLIKVYGPSSRLQQERYIWKQVRSPSTHEVAFRKKQGHFQTFHAWKAGEISLLRRPDFWKKTALRAGSARGTKKSFSFTAFFWVFLLDNRRTHAMMVSES